MMTNTVQLYIGYSKDVIKATGGSYRMSNYTNVYSELVKAFLTIYDRTTDKDEKIRRVGVSFANLVEAKNEQLNLFVDQAKIDRERKLETAINGIKKAMGKNSVVRGMNYLECATTLERNKMIRGLNSGEFR